MKNEWIISIGDDQNPEAGVVETAKWIQEVVRCKDCVKRPYDNCPFNEHTTYKPEDDFYCAEGIREWPISIDTKVLVANLKEDIDLLTRNKNPTDENRKIITDIGIAISLLKGKE